MYTKLLANDSLKLQLQMLLITCYMFRLWGICGAPSIRIHCTQRLQQCLCDYAEGAGLQLLGHAGIQLVRMSMTQHDCIAEQIAPVGDKAINTCPSWT